MLVHVNLKKGTPLGLGLQHRFNRTRKKLISLFDGFPEGDSISSNLQYQLYGQLEDHPDSKKENAKTWYGATFYGIPTAAAVAILTKLSNDAHNAKKIVHQEVLRVMSQEEPPAPKHNNLNSSRQYHRFLETLCSS